MTDTSLNTTCPQCGAPFHCGRGAAGERCWCAALPAVMPVPADAATGAGCLCPACLNKAIEQRRANPPLQQVGVRR